MPPDPNKVFEVSITSFIKVDYKGKGDGLDKGMTKMHKNKFFI
jgi:hypothetical protein